MRNGSKTAERELSSEARGVKPVRLSRRAGRVGGAEAGRECWPRRRAKAVMTGAFLSVGKNPRRKRSGRRLCVGLERRAVRWGWGKRALVLVGPSTRCRINAQGHDGVGVGVRGIRIFFSMHYTQKSLGGASSTVPSVFWTKPSIL